MSESDLITRHFAHRGVDSDEVVLGIGDDAAILAYSNSGGGHDSHLAISCDTLIEGVHFPPRGDPEDIGYRALAVNLSDLAAMGARPVWAMLALTVPDQDESWLASFSSGFFSLANQYKVQLIGGDTTRGPLSITITTGGPVDKADALKRDTANVGDIVFVSGYLGDAAAGLAAAAGSQSFDDDGYLEKRFWRPEPRVDLGLALRNLATAAIDVSDGLVADLARLATASQAGALIDIDAIPLSKAMQSGCDRDTALKYALSGGDDYELCFTVAPGNREAVFEIADQLPVTAIGKIRGDAGIYGRDESGTRELDITGYDHFASGI